MSVTFVNCGDKVNAHVTDVKYQKHRINLAVTNKLSVKMIYDHLETIQLSQNRWPERKKKLRLNKAQNNLSDF